MISWDPELERISPILLGAGLVLLWVRFYIWLRYEREVPKDG